MEVKKDLIHIKPLVTVAIALYYASADERHTVVCFFVFQETRDP